MENDREFKGVWIPKEIWLNNELTLIEKVIFTEIDSLDNENNCTAGNDYFATFCNCSESKVSKSIRHLQDLNLIEVIEFDGRHRKVRVVKNTKQSSKIYKADYENIRPNNINNNKDNKIFLSKDKNMNTADTENFFGSIKTQKQEKDADKINLFLDMYNSYKELPAVRKIGTSRKKAILHIMNSFSIEEIHQVLDNFSKSDFLLGKATDFKANVDWVLNENNFIKILEGRYNNRVNKHSFNDNAVSETYTEEELKELEELNKEREARGLQTKF